MTLPVAIEEISLENAATIYKDGGLKPFLDHIRGQVSGEVPDISTAKGRDRIKSLAAQVSKSKTAVEKPGREYLKQIKELPRTIEKELREFVDACDALRDEIRKPVTEFEEKEAARIAKHEAAILVLNQISQTQTATRGECLAMSTQIDLIQLDESCEEFLHRYVAASKLAKETIALIIESISQAEEQERLRKETELAAQKEREERIAREAKESAEREAAEREERLKREQEEAMRAAEKAAIERELRIKLEAEQAAKQAEIDKQVAIQKAEDEKNRAIEEERLKAEFARKIEAEAKEAAEREEAKKAANKAHQKTVNNEILSGLIALGVSDEIGKAIICAAAKNQLGQMIIKY